MNLHHHLACDLGVDSGREMLATLAEGKLTLEEMQRFPSAVVKVFGSLRWDVRRIFEELKTGLRKVTQRGMPIASLSMDSWGVDYVNANRVHPMLAASSHYRDHRTESTCGVLRDRIGACFNDLFSGAPRVDESNAGAPQLCNPRTRDGSDRLIELCGMPRRIFPKLVPPGTVPGPMLPQVENKTGISGARGRRRSGRVHCHRKRARAGLHARASRLARRTAPRGARSLFSRELPAARHRELHHRARAACMRGF